jgi:hypothetical protein
MDDNNLGLFKQSIKYEIFTITGIVFNLGLTKKMALNYTRRGLPRLNKA